MYPARPGPGLQKQRGRSMIVHRSDALAGIRRGAHQRHAAVQHRRRTAAGFGDSVRLNEVLMVVADVENGTCVRIAACIRSTPITQDSVQILVISVCGNRRKPEIIADKLRAGIGIGYMDAVKRIVGEGFVRDAVTGFG